MGTNSRQQVRVAQDITQAHDTGQRLHANLNLKCITGHASVGSCTFNADSVQVARCRAGSL